MDADFTIFVVDDDAAVRDSLAVLLEAEGYAVECHGSGHSFLDAFDASRGGCLLLDVRLPDVSGLDLQAALASLGIDLPVIVITGYGDIPMAVRAMQSGAMDFIEKPLDAEALLDSLRRARAESERRGRDAAFAADAVERIGSLTPRERQVLELLVVGHPNKVIAYELGVSPRTVEIHRSRVMEKMAARNLSQLVRMALAAGLDPDAA